MSTHIQDACGSFKALIAETPGTPTQKLIAVLAALGVDKTADLAAMIGVGERAIQKAKTNSSSANSSSENEPQFAETNHSSRTPVRLHARIDNIITTNQVKCSEVKESKPLSLSRPKGEAHGTRLPADWSLSHDLHQWTRTTFPQTTNDRVALELETFRDYWASVPGQKGRKADWNATWRVWSKRAFATAPIRPMSQPPPAAKTVSQLLAEKYAHAEGRA